MEAPPAFSKLRSFSVKAAMGGHQIDNNKPFGIGRKLYAQMNV
jgi:hypothetical protein